jgi:hypothetical protein
MNETLDEKMARLRAEEAATMARAQAAYAATTAALQREREQRLAEKAQADAVALRKAELALEWERLKAQR